MKTIKAIILLAGILVQYTLHADIIPENSHYVAKCVKITNTSEYHDIRLIGDVNNLVGEDYSYVISDTECLNKGYKFNSFAIYAVPASYIEGKDINTIDWSGNSNAVPADTSIEPVGYYVDNSNPVVGEEQYYKIAGFTNTSIVLYKWKEVIRYNDGTPDKVQTYSYTGQPLLFQEMPASVPIIPYLYGVKIFPNPSSDDLNVQMSNGYTGPVDIALFSITGVALDSYFFEKYNETSTFVIPIKKLQGGIYFVRLQMDNFIATHKIKIN